jgi:uncharacterized protein (DUF3820 family)
MNKKAVFKELLDKFETEKMRLYCEDMIELIPDYIFTIPSSTSIRFHNATQCKPHGQVYHIVMFGKIMNYLLDLKCNQEKFSSPIQRDAMRCIPIFHDALKCGFEQTEYSVHDHPMLAGKWVRDTKVEHDIEDGIKERIARMCERHSGSFTTSKYSDVVLPEPENEMEILCHECDVLSSRSDLDILPSEYLETVLGMEPESLPDIDSWQFDFGKFKGKTISDVAIEEIGYLYWIQGNYFKQPANALVKKYLSERTKD